jgi:glycosyltransferase involved in cell wall biosynthesis
MGNDRLSVLMELRPALDGFAGIPQETRLIFAALAQMSEVKLAGMLQHQSKQLLPGLDDAQCYTDSARLNVLSRHVISHGERTPAQGRLSRYTRELRRRVGLVPLYAGLLARTRLGLSLPLTSFKAESFEDFIWTRLFSKSLPPADLENIIGAGYKVLRAPHTALHNVGLLPFNRSRYPIIDTRGFDFLIAQTPFPGRVARPSKLVVRYHDAIPIFLPHTISAAPNHQASHYSALRSNVPHAHFVCTSEATRADLLKLFPEVEKRTNVIYDMVSHEYTVEKTTRAHLSELIRTHLDPDSAKLPTSKLDTSQKLPHQPIGAEPAETNGFRYVMMVSTLEARKNHLALITAWERMRAGVDRDLRLVIVGSLGWHYDAVLKAMCRWQERGEIFHLSGVPARDLRLLYNGAEAVICPSFSEGFDYSGAEAMLCGTPVIASRIPVHTEVYGDCAEYFNPYDPNELFAAMTNLLSAEGRAKRRTLIERGLKHAQRYTQASITPRWLDYLRDLKSQSHTAHPLAVMQPAAPILGSSRKRAA